MLIIHQRDEHKKNKMPIDITLKNKNILFATTPAAGHFNPLTGLAKYLNETGNEVRWYTSKDFKPNLDLLAIPHYPFKQAQDINFKDLNSYFPEREKLKSPLERMNFDMINLFANRSTEYFADIREIREELAFDMVVCDNTFSAIPIISTLLNIPVVVIGVMPLAERSAHLAPYGLGILPAKNFLENIKNKLMNAVLRNILAKKSIRSFQRTLKPYGISDTNRPLLDLLVKKADLFLQIGAPEFEYERPDLGKNIKYIGGLTPAAAPANLWDDERLRHYKKIILVTQGTVEKNLQNLIIPTLEAFKLSETLVIVTTGGNQTSELKKLYDMDNVIIEDYIPYEFIMPHVHVYVTNGGYGGVLQSIKYGLPVVAAGVFEGKSEICSRIGHFDYGIDLKSETPESESIKRAVNEVFYNDLYRTNVGKLASIFRNMNSLLISSIYINQMLTSKHKTI
jgi:UDP:flavonoid glycosyltransferase YjiC (YdhE family)